MYVDLFKQNNNNKATSLDFYATDVVIQNTRVRPKDKRMLHRLARSRIRRMTRKEFDEV